MRKKIDPLAYLFPFSELDDPAPYGEPEHKEKPIKAAEAATLIIRELDRRGLEAPIDITWLLAENRRNPYSPSAIKVGVARGNRNKWGYIPTVQLTKLRVGYYPSQLTRWMEAELFPKCERVTV